MKMKHFICPICRTRLSPSPSGASLLCENEGRQHCFDVSASGYVNLDREHSGGGDSKECVRHRSAFLQKGYYTPIMEKLCDLAKKYTREDALLLDAGCGEGYYTANLAKALPSSPVIGIDISKYAAEHGAKYAKREGISNISFAVASIFSLPLADSAAGCITNVFAPCQEEEFGRVLEDGGILITVAAGKKHLMGLKKALYDDVYENEARADMPESRSFTVIDRIRKSFQSLIISRPRWK